MSDPIVKGVKRHSSRPSPLARAKHRSAIRASAPSKTLAKRSSADKAPARKASKAVPPTSARNKPSKKVALSRQEKASSKKTKISTINRKTSARVATPAITRGKVKNSSKVIAPPLHPGKSRSKAVRSDAKQDAVKRGVTPQRVQAKPVKPAARPGRNSDVRRQPTQDEAAALQSFEHAHKEFSRGKFAEARTLFRTVVEKHSGVSEVAARARTYLAIAEARLRTEITLPRDADSLYDRGVIELNRGEYVAAQEMFERALKREPDAPHVHYGLAATRARLGSIELALESLQHALGLQPSLRVRAQHDIDLVTLRNEPDFERLVFTSRF